MGMTLSEELELLLEKKCSSRCLDDEQDRKEVARTIAEYLQEEDHEAGGDSSSGTAERR